MIDIESSDGDVYSVEVVHPTGPVLEIIIRAERCEICGERVRYWNSAAGGNAACGCTTEGAEPCDRVMLRPQVLALLELAVRSIRVVDAWDLPLRQRRLLEERVDDSCLETAFGCAVAVGLGFIDGRGRRFPAWARDQLSAHAEAGSGDGDPSSVEAVRALIGAVDARCAVLGESGAADYGPAKGSSRRFECRAMTVLDLLVEVGSCTPSAHLMVQGKRWSGAPGASELVDGGSWPAIEVERGTFVGAPEVAGTPWVKIRGSDAWIYIPGRGRWRPGLPAAPAEGSAGGPAEGVSDLMLEASRDLMVALARWNVDQVFDDDQDPGVDTPAQRLVREYRRWRALGGRDLTSSCDVCQAVGHGNATCWHCVAHWSWMRPQQRQEFVAALIAREPGRPCGAADVEAFVARLGGSVDDVLGSAERAAAILRRGRRGRRSVLADALEAAVGALRAGPPMDDRLRLHLAEFASRGGAWGGVARALVDRLGVEHRVVLAVDAHRLIGCVCGWRPSDDRDPEDQAAEHLALTRPPPPDGDGRLPGK